MADDRVVSEIVTKFFLDTCQLREQMNEDSVLGFASGFLLLAAADEIKLDDKIVNLVCIPLTTGSAAEFYISPMFKCIGDVDVMCCSTCHLAIPAGTSPPTQLPAEFHSYVAVCEIIDSEFPGYVYLPRSYSITECTDDGKYKEVQLPRKYTSMNIPVDNRSHGPAMSSQFTVPGQQYFVRYAESMYSVDLVGCMRCLSWPPQAADWPSRHRAYGWPDSATVGCVKRNGCDVVSVAHPLCKQVEWINKHQWRLSFSRAEIVLLNSWMHVQQIVYHMLRVFVKTERFTNSENNAGVKAFTNYHIKTLMLWACELKPRSWWTDDLNVVRICVELLHTLAVWLNDGRCANYFIINCNLLDYCDNLHYTQCVARQLLSVSEPWLAEWFINNYVRKCAQICPEHVSRSFDDITTTGKLQNAVSAVEWQWLGLPRSSFRRRFQSFCYFEVAQSFVSDVFSCPSLTLRSCLCAMRVIAENDQCLCVYFIATTFLHVACKTTGKSLTGELLDVLAATCLQSNDARRWLSARHSSVLSLSQAARLMKVVANNSRSTVQLIEIELSKAYLYRALRCKDSDSDSIYCLANFYLAVLYYVTGQYQTAIDFCKLVTRAQDHSRCSSHVVQGELLPNNAAYDRGLCSSRDHTKPVMSCQLDTSELVELLQLSAVEHLTKFRQVQADEFGSVAVDTEFVFGIVTTDFEALYAYKCGEYQRCLQLSTHNVHKLLVADETLSILSYPEFIQLMDNNIASLVGLTLIVNTSSRGDPKQSREHRQYVSISQLALSLYLLSQCKMRLHHSATSVAQTLGHVEVARRKFFCEGLTLDQLLLKLNEREMLHYLVNLQECFVIF